MKLLFLILSILLLSFAVTAGETSPILPGAILAWQDDPQPTAGLSLKRVELLDEQWFTFGSFEIRAFYPSGGSYRMDLSWPNFFGFLNPGISAEWSGESFTPWVYGEIDLFYFPSLFVTMILFEKPRLIPSVYLAIRTDFHESRWETGLRLSFPLGSWNP